MNKDDFFSTIEKQRQSPEFQTYLKVRDWVLDILAWGAGRDNPSAYWHEELGTFDYLFDASPLVIQKLRHHCYPITGVRPYDYRSTKQAKATEFKERFRALVERTDHSLVIPEAPELGGFGYEVDGELYNIDTLKFAEVLIGLDEAGVLQSLKKDKQRKLLLEIGSGWGGFAYQLKKTIPTATVMLVDLPQVFLFSGVYMQILFPGSKFYFFDPKTAERELKNWHQYDFIFIPNTAWKDMPNLPIHLAVNMVSFQEMTSDQVRGYVQGLADRGCAHLYSLNRDCSAHNSQLTNVRDIIAERYVVEPISILETGYTCVKGKRAGSEKKASKPGDYQHVYGRLENAPIEGKSSFGQRTRVVLAMVTRDNEATVRVSLESLCAQTFAGLKVLVWDDGSEDETVRIVQEVVGKDPRIFLRKHKKKAGMLGARNVLIREALDGFTQAEYIGWVDPAVFYDPKWLEGFIRNLAEKPEVGGIVFAEDEGDGFGDERKGGDCLVDFHRLKLSGLHGAIFRKKIWVDCGRFRNVRKAEKLWLLDASLHCKILWKNNAASKSLSSFRVPAFREKNLLGVLPSYVTFPLFFLKRYFGQRTSLSDAGQSKILPFVFHVFLRELIGGLRPGKRQSDSKGGVNHVAK